ncbi:MAG: hypothetical protein IJC88_04810 [Oscillospiraceae bacterium]|nr:hypothetical protein [Oscillospiraceae bacterium]
MGLLIFILKLILVLVITALPAVPFVLEYITLKRDQEQKISFKRLRVLLYTLGYLIVATILLCFIDGLITWLRDLPVLKQVFDLLEACIEGIAKKLSLVTRYGYYTKVVGVIVLNFFIGMIYRWVSKVVRIGLKKKDLTKPKKGKHFTRIQRFERRVICFFHNETWFFVAEILKFFNLALSALYLGVFLLYQLPGVFGFNWLPFDFIYMLFESGYLFPAVTMLVLWQSYFFLEGIRRVRDECPELLEEEKEELATKEVDLAAIDEAVKKQFADYYVCDLDLSDQVAAEIFSADHHPLTQFIGQAVERDERSPHLPNDTYLTAMDGLFSSEKSALISGSFFTEFARYFLRYLSIILSRGDNVIFVCNTESQIESVYEFLNEALASITSLYCKEFSKDAVDFDDPIWRIVKVSGEHDSISEAMVDDSNVLVTSLGYLCSNRFETEHSRFVPMVDSVVFVDTLTTINCYHRQVAILNNRLKHIARENSNVVRNAENKSNFQRYLSRKIRYFCFDDSRTPGLDKVLKNMLSVNLESLDIMCYSRSTLVRCYNYEGRLDGSGRQVLPQFFHSEEEVGALINVAILCLAKGANSVNIFADGAIPFENYAETIAANRGQVLVKADGNNICINRHRYDADGYSVVIAMDSGDNLPATLRRYISMMPEKPTLVIVFSRPYLLRDFYQSNLKALWSASQLERIPVEEGTRKDLAQRILVKANAGGITTAEVMQLASNIPQLNGFVQAGDLNAILRIVLECYGVPKEERIDLFTYFEYAASHTFDANGKYVSEERIFLRRKGKLFDLINGRNMVVLSIGDQEQMLPVPKSRLTQNFIAGQNVLFDGKIYHILKVDTASGKLYGRLAVGGKNDEVYEYLQKREYHVELSHGEGETNIEKVFQTKHLVLNENEGSVGLTDAFVSVFRAPAEVLTYGYFDVDPHTMTRSFKDGRYHSICDANNDLLFKQTYRRYGTISNPKISSEEILCDTNLISSTEGLMMMSVRLVGNFGAGKDKALQLLTVMLNELLRSMFPSVIDSIAVCPVLKEEFTDEESAQVLAKYPKVTFDGVDEAVSKDEFNFIIVEDSETDLGVVSVLLRAGDDLLRTLFAPINGYLEWYFSAEQKSEYLYFGMDHEPACFDFSMLRDVSRILGDRKHDIRFVELSEIVEYEECSFCGKRYRKGDSINRLGDGRLMCKECAEHLVGNNKKVLKAHLERAKLYLENTYGIRLDEDYEFCFESTVKLANTLKQNRELHRQGADVSLKSYIDESKRVHVECDLPSANLSELLVRELTHVWQLSHLKGVENLLSGHLALVGVQYLRSLKENGLADSRTAYFESTEAVSGVEYRTLVQELLLHPEFGNNPFLYLLKTAGISSGDEAMPIPPELVENGSYGEPYVPSEPDRATDGTLKYFYRERLTESQRGMYDTVLEALCNHEESVDLAGIEFEDAKIIIESIAYDHPELFWMKEHYSLSADRLTLNYGCTAEEARVMEARMEPVISKFLDGITPEMSAYDVAVMLYRRILKMVDYDTIALNKEREHGGPDHNKIDMLRAICGVFTDGKAVCEGYARALQYLLQKCGVECAEAAGMVHKGNGEEGSPHAWNIVKIDGDYYYLDVTWDDDSNTVQSVKQPRNQGYAYFCITTEELSRSRDTSLCPVAMPVCDAVRANYFVHNGLVLEAYDLKKLKEIAKATAESGNNFITFKCTSKAVYDTAMENLFTKGDDVFALAKVAAKANKSLKSGRVSYTWDDQMLVVCIIMEMK